MTERADQLHYDNAPAHSTAIVQVFFGKASHHPGMSAPLQPIFVSLLAFPKAEIAIEREEICECNGHTVHKLNPRCLTANLLAPWESDCSWMHSKVSSDWLPSYIMATRPVFEIFKMSGYFPDSPRTFTLSGVYGAVYVLWSCMMVFFPVSICKVFKVCCCTFLALSLFYFLTHWSYCSDVHEVIMKDM